MNLLTDLPKASLYAVVQTQPLSVSEKDLVNCLDEARLDPRLMEICTEYLRDHWWNLNGALLNRAARRARFPFMVRAALVVVWDYCEIPPFLEIEFKRFIEQVLRGLKHPAPQLLYAGIHRIGSKSMAEVLEQALPVWREMGLIEKSLPFNKARAGALKGSSWMKDSLELRKSFAVQKLKAAKASGLSNADLMAKTKMNRVSLSKALNHKVDGISLDYLVRAAERV